MTPFGEPEANAARGTLLGNRGILHDQSHELGKARWRHPHWITCTLAFKNRKQPINAPGRYTQLFFLDEAVALAAGHRPCAECRRDAFRAYRDALHDPDLRRAPDIDRALHRARVTRSGARVLSHMTLDEVPGGAMFVRGGHPGEAWLKNVGALWRWTHAGYRDREPAKPAERVWVLTPSPSLTALRNGFCPSLHPSTAA